MPINSPDNISTSTNSGPQQGSGTGGIAHITGEGAFNFSGNDTTMPNSSTTSFKDLIDIGFRKTLETIGFMKVVVERIEHKQNITIEYIKETLAGNKVMNEKIDDLRKTLSKMEDDKRKSSMSEDLKRREEELEKLTKPTLVSGREGVDGTTSDNSSSSFWFLAIPVAAAILGQVFHMAPQIRGFLEFIKGTEKLISGLAGGASGGASGAAAGTVAASKFSSIFNAGKAGLMSTVASTASSMTRAGLWNVVKWLNKLKWAARGLVVFDALFTIIYARATADDPQGAENAFMRAFGKVVGGTGGAWILGSLCGIMVGWIPVAGVVLGPLALIGGAIAGGYYGTIAGEEFGRAVYRLFASDYKDFSGFYSIWNKIQSGLVAGIDSMFGTSSSTTPSGNSSPTGESGAGWDRDAQKKRDADLKDKMDAITKPSVGGSPAPVVVGGGSGSFSPSGDSKTLRSYSDIPDDINGIHKRVSSRSGIPLNVVQSFGDIESSNSNKDNQGKYRGLYQVKGSNDPKFQEDRMVANFEYYNKIFRETFKRNPEPWEIYLMHQQGEYGGRAICAAYFNGDKNMKAAEGLCKWMKKLFNSNFTLENAYTNFRGNIGHTHTGQPKSWTPYYVDLMNKYIKQGIPLNNVIEYLCRNMTINDIYTAFYVGLTDRMKFYSDDKKTSSTTRGKAPVSAGMTPVSYSPSDYSGGDHGPTGKSQYQGTNVDTSGYSNIPSYGPGGSNTFDDQKTRYDKSLDKNHPALDVLVSIVSKKGLIPSGSVVSFNDKHHGGVGKTHGSGLGVDISQAGGTKQGRDALISAIQNCGREYGVNIAAEDHTGRGNSTGQHVHAYFRSRQDADTFLTNWLKRNGVKGKSPTLSGSSPEIMAQNPSSGSTLMAYGMGSQQPKVVQVTQPVIVNGGGSGGGGRKGGGTSGPIPSSFRPSNRDILNAYL